MGPLEEFLVFFLRKCSLIEFHAHFGNEKRSGRVSRHSPFSVVCAEKGWGTGVRCGEEAWATQLSLVIWTTAELVLFRWKVSVYTETMT